MTSWQMLNFFHMCVLFSLRQLLGLVVVLNVFILLESLAGITESAKADAGGGHF